MKGEGKVMVAAEKPEQPLIGWAAQNLEFSLETIVGANRERLCGCISTALLTVYCRDFQLVHQ